MWLPRTLFVAGAGLMSYGINLLDPFRRAAEYVDCILKGEKPPTCRCKYELVINLKAAKALSLAMPPAVFSRTDEEIE